jgi:hypothetical protein
MEYPILMTLTGKNMLWLVSFVEYLEYASNYSRNALLDVCKPGLETLCSLSITSRHVWFAARPLISLIEQIKTKEDSTEISGFVGAP